MLSNYFIELFKLINMMAVRITRNPVFVQLGMLISLLIVIFLYSSILISVSKSQDINLCIPSNATNATCWDSDFTNIQRLIHCPFTLVFVAILVFTVSLILFLIAGIVKCLRPEIYIKAYRNKCCRRLNQFYLIVFHLIAIGFCLAFTALVIKYDSCYYSADMLRNCTIHRTSCWMFCIAVLALVFSLVTLGFSGLDARKFYVERLEDEMCDQLYNEYLITDGDSELVNTLPE